MTLFYPQVTQQIGGNTSGATALIQSGTMTLAGGNNITLSQAGNAVTISAFNQTNQTLGLYAVSNTTQSTSGTYDARTLSFHGAGIASVGISNGSVMISVPAGGGAAGTNTFGMSNLGNTSGTTGVVSDTGVRFLFAGGNNVTLSQSLNGVSGTITISAFNQSVESQSIGMHTSTAGGTTGGTSGFASGGQIQYNFFAGTGISLSQSVNGASGSLTFYSPAMISSFEPYPMHNTGTGQISLATNTSAPMSFFPMQVDNYLAAEMLGIIVSMSYVSGGTSSFQQSGTLNWGLYSRETGANSTRLLLAGSNSFSYAATYNNSSGTASFPTTTNAGGGGYGYGTISSAGGGGASASFTGRKLLWLGLGSTISPGQYWLGIHHRNSSSSFNSGIRMSIIGNAMSLTDLKNFGGTTIASTGTDLPSMLNGNWQLGNASYSLAALTSVVQTVTMSQMTQNQTLMPYMKFASRA